MWKFFPIPVAFFLLTGCKYIKPEHIPQTHSAYGSTLVRASNKQLLTNIARLKYRDNPCFLEINEVTEERNLSFDWGTGGNGIELTRDAKDFRENVNPGTVFVNKTYKLSPYFRMGLYQRPRVTYTNVRGKKLAEWMANPIPVKTAMDLLEGDWNCDCVLDLCLKPTATPWTMNGDLNGDYYRQRDIKFQHAETLKTLEPIRAWHQRTCLLQGLNPELQRKIPANFNLRTRSMREILTYLSGAVEVPKADQEAGLVPATTEDADPHPAKRWFHIHCLEGKDPPTTTFVHLHYRGTWFYILDSDLDSKGTFSLFSFLLDMQSSEKSEICLGMIFLKSRLAGLSR
jgi:hypothetical protein